MIDAFQLTRVLFRAALLSLLAGVYTCAVILIERRTEADVPDLPGPLVAALIFVASLLLGFRTNRAYERWWEARTLWGRLISVSRNLAVKVRGLIQPSAEEKAEVLRLTVDYGRRLRDHLSGGAAGDAAGQGHIPSSIVTQLYAVLNRWKKWGLVSDAELLILDRELREFLEVCGGCERIKNTPTAISWRRFVRQVTAIYLFILPWGLPDAFGFWNVPLMVLIAYLVIGVEAIAHYVEEPFGDTEDHLDLEAICSSIERSCSEILGGQDVSSRQGMAHG